MEIEVIENLGGHFNLWDGDKWLAECGKGVEGEERANAIFDEIVNLQLANNELRTALAATSAALEEALHWRAIAEDSAQVCEGLRSERDEAGAILGEIAAATAEQGALFIGDHGRDDWPTAIAWLKKHISLTPEQSMLEQHCEAINGWRQYAQDERKRADAELATLRQLARDLTQTTLAYSDHVVYVPRGAFERLRDAVESDDAGLSKNRSVSGDGE